MTTVMTELDILDLPYISSLELIAKAPPWATGAIIADYVTDTSDISVDLHSAEVGLATAIGWRSSGIAARRSRPKACWVRAGVRAVPQMERVV